jgi:nucleoside-triphosphatase THEP1
VALTDDQSRPRLAILTGDIGAGKTTAALAVVRMVAERGLSVGGILSPARLAADGTKVGIDLLDLATGERRVLATVGGDLDGPMVGPYAFSAASIELGIQRVRAGIEDGRGLVCVDELGRLEFERGEGFAPLLDVVVSGWYRRMLAVVRFAYAERMRGLAASAGVASVALFHVAAMPESRARVPREVAEWLAGSDSAR